MELRLTGAQPLIMHNVQAADPYNPFARAMKEFTSKRKKTDGDLLEIDRLKFLSGLYYDAEVGPYLPAPNVFRALIEAGTITKSGKKIERGVTFLSRLAPLEYNGPRTPDELWGDNGDTPFVDRRIVVVNRSRIPGVRQSSPTGPPRSTSRSTPTSSTATSSRPSPDARAGSASATSAGSTESSP